MRMRLGLASLFLILCAMGCRLLGDDDHLLSLHLLEGRAELEIQVMSLDVGQGQTPLRAEDTVAFNQLGSIIQQSEPDIVGIQRLDPAAIEALLARLPRYDYTRHDPFEAAASEHPLLIFRRDRFEADAAKSGKQFRGLRARAQYLIEKSTGKSIFVGQLAWFDTDETVQRETLKRVFEHMEVHRQPSDMLLFMGHWPEGLRLPALWADVMEKAYPGRKPTPRLVATPGQEDYMLCDKANCEVLAAEIQVRGDFKPFAFGALPLASKLRLYAEKPTKAWRLAFLRKGQAPGHDF